MYLGLLNKNDCCYLSKHELDEMKFTDNELAITLNQLPSYTNNDNNFTQSIISISNIKKLIKCYLKVRLIVNDSHSLVYWLKFGDDETIQTFNQIKIGDGINDIMAFKYGDYNILDKWFKQLNNEIGDSINTSTPPLSLLRNQCQLSNINPFLFEYCKNDIEKQKLFIINICNYLNSNNISTHVFGFKFTFFRMILVNNNLELVKLTFSLLKNLLKNISSDVYRYINSSCVLEFIYNIHLNNKEYFKYSGDFQWITNGRIDLLSTFQSINSKNGITKSFNLTLEPNYSKLWKFENHDNYLKIIKFVISNDSNVYDINRGFLNNILSNSITSNHELMVIEILKLIDHNWYSSLSMLQQINNFNECIINILKWMIDNNKLNKYASEIAYYITGNLNYLFNGSDDSLSFISKLPNWYNYAIQCNDIKVILMILDKLINQSSSINDSQVISIIQEILNGLFENGYSDSLISINDKYPNLLKQQNDQVILEFIDRVIHNDNIELIPFLNQHYPNLLKQYQIPLIDHKTTCYAYIKNNINNNNLL